MSLLSTKTKTTLLAFATVIAAFFALASGAAEAQQPQAFSSWPRTTSQDDTRFTLEANARLFNRRGDDLDLPLLLDSVTNVPIFGSSDATDLDLAAGAEVRLGIKGRSGVDWEIRTIAASWDSAFLFDQPNIITAFGNQTIGAGLEPDFVDITYDSRLFSLELSARKNTVPGLTVLAGPRVISLVEEYEIDSQDTIIGAGGPLIINRQDLIEAKNTLYGFQLGLEYNLPVSQKVYVSVFSRVGAYFNPTRARSVTTSTTGQFAAFESASTAAAGSLDAGVRAYWEILPRSAYGFIGFEILGIDGIATAPSQLLTLNIPTVETATTLFSESLSFGVRFNY